MEQVKYMVLDITSNEQARIVAIAPLKEAQLIGKIMQAQGRAVIAPPLEGRGFSKLEPLMLQYLFWNTTQTPPPTVYADLMKAMQAAAEALPVDETPLHELEKTVRDLYPDEKQSSDGKTEPKQPKAPGTPAERPTGTSTTGRVWELADAEYALHLHKMPDGGAIDWKALRDAIMTSCINGGINKATAATQYSKWKGAKLASASA